MYIKETGLITKHMDMAPIYIKMVQGTKEAGSMTSSKVMEWKLGQMEQNIKANTLKDKKTF